MTVVPEAMAGSPECDFIGGTDVVDGAAKPRGSYHAGRSDQPMTNDSALDRAAPSNLRTDLALGRPPRVAVFRPLVRFGFIATAVVLVIATVIVVLTTRSVARGLERLRDHGVATDARVERKWRSGGKSRTKHLAFSFVHEGKRIEGQASVSSGTWSAAEPGKKLLITFDPDDPAHTEVGRVSQATVDRHWTTVFWVSGTVGVLFLGCYVGVFCRLNRRRRLLEDGELAQVRIESIGKPTRKSRKSKVAFASHAGSRATRSSIPAQLLQGLEPGDSVPFLVAPDDPDRGEPLAMVLSTCRLAEAGS